MINIAIFDMDGTLTSRLDNTIPASTLNAIKQLKEQNIKIVVATGRPFYGFIKKDLDLIEADAYVLNNGRIVLDKDHQKLFDQPIEPDFLNSTIDLINELNLDYALHLEHETLVLRGKSIQKVINKLTSKADHIRSVNVLPKNSNVYNIMVHLTNKVEINYFKNTIPNAMVEEFAEDFYDIYPNNMNKSIGIQFILNKYKTNWSNTIAFGDGLNDQSFLSKSANAYCMEDGHDDLKSIRGISIAPSSKDDGIQKVLIKRGLIEKADHAYGWIRFKHRFLMTNMRYTLPISLFLILFFIYDFIMNNITNTSYSYLLLAMIFLYQSINHYLKDKI